METDHAAMPGPSKIRERIMNLNKGAAQGSPIEASLDKSGRTGSEFHPADTIAHCATSDISARSDYSLTGHNDVCFDV